MTLRKDEYARRRKQLMKLMGKGAIAIIPAAPERQRNNDVHYHYRPDSDFHYLTGFNEPESVAVLARVNSLLLAPQVSCSAGLL